MSITLWHWNISGDILVLFMIHGSMGWFSWKVREIMWCFISETIKKLSLWPLPPSYFKLWYLSTVFLDCPVH